VFYRAISARSHPKASYTDAFANEYSLHPTHMAPFSANMRPYFIYGPEGAS